MVQLPHVLHRPGAPHVPEYPRGSRTGFARPVDRFRLTLSPVALTILAFFVWRNCSWLLPRTRISYFNMIGMLNADFGMLSALGMLNLGMLDAGFGMLSASGMQDFLLHSASVLL